MSFVWGTKNNGNEIIEINLNDFNKLIGGSMRRGGYSMNLKKQIKIRIDEATLKYLIKISNKRERTLSWLLRDIIQTSLEKSARF